MFPSILDKLEYAGWIEQTVGDRGKVVKGAQTVIYPGPRLVSRMDAVDISLADMGIADQSDPIILQRPKKDRRLFGAREEYEDNERTRQFRSEMDQINGWLGKADLEVLDASDIAVDDTGAAIIRLHDPAKRKLRRYFTDSDHTFTSGGRLFGGFWQNMTKAERRDLLLIMVDVLLRLMKMEIVALPVHDAVLIAESKADQTKAVMLEAFRDHVGFPGSVTFEN